jgi:hypothetical protein
MAAVKIGEILRHPQYFGCSDCPQWVGFPFIYSYHSGGRASLHRWDNPRAETADHMVLLVGAAFIFWAWCLYRKKMAAN